MEVLVFPSLANYTKTSFAEQMNKIISYRDAHTNRKNKLGEIF